MIGETGKNLSVIIVTEFGKDWETFETWYSFFKNLPDANMVIACQRTSPVPFQMFQWCRRLKLKLFFYNKISKDDSVVNWLEAIRKAKQQSFAGENALVVSPLITAIDVLNPTTISKMDKKEIWINNKVWFVKNQNIEKLIDARLIDGHEFVEDEEPIYLQANETEHLYWLVDHRKGCGKWIDTLRGCPFSSAAGLASETMTINESRIIDLWKKMCSLYNALM